MQPSVDRWHRAATPLLGGAAIALAVLGVLAVALPPVPPILFVAAGMAFALGLLDDFRHLAPSTKLVGQALIATTAAYGGIHVELIPFAPLAFLLTVLWLVTLMNAVNLLDNMDGLAAGVAVIGAVVLGVTAVTTNPLVSTIAGATAGGAAGFLVHNFHPARVFMGDAGSLFLGFLLGAVALLHTSSGAADVGLAVLGPLAVLALPIFDTAFVTTLRQLAGRPISQGGRDHVSHRLAALGLSDRTVVLVLYVVAAGLALIGVVGDLFYTLVAPLFALAAVGLILFGVFLAEVDVYGRRSARGDKDVSPVRRALAVYGRFGAEVGLDVTLLTTAYYLAYVIRFEALPQSAWLYLFVPSLPLIVGAQLAALVAFGVYRALWRYLNVSDALVTLRAVVVGTAGGTVGIFLLYRLEDYSRAVLLLDAIIATGLLVGSRAFLAWLRQWFASRPHRDARRVLIVGANDNGVIALRLLRRTTHHPVGFLDDDPGKRYRRVGGVPIVGTTADLEQMVPRLRVDLVLFALEGREHDIEALRTVCETLGVEWRDFLVAV